MPVVVLVLVDSDSVTGSPLWMSLGLVDEDKVVVEGVGVVCEVSSASASVVSVMLSVLQNIKRAGRAGGQDRAAGVGFDPGWVNLLVFDFHLGGKTRIQGR